jgi:hypothetical protein
MKRNTLGSLISQVIGESIGNSHTKTNYERDLRSMTPVQIVDLMLHEPDRSMDVDTSSAIFTYLVEADDKTREAILEEAGRREYFQVDGRLNRLRRLGKY